MYIKTLFLGLMATAMGTYALNTDMKCNYYCQPGCNDYRGTLPISIVQENHCASVECAVKSFVCYDSDGSSIPRFSNKGDCSLSSGSAQAWDGSNGCNDMKFFDGYGFSWSRRR
jgi:hypothetical protein